LPIFKKSPFSRIQARTFWPVTQEPPRCDLDAPLDLLVFWPFGLWDCAFSSRAILHRILQSRRLAQSARRVGASTVEGTALRASRNSPVSRGRPCIESDTPATRHEFESAQCIPRARLSPSVSGPYTCKPQGPRRWTCTAPGKNGAFTGCLNNAKSEQRPNAKGRPNAKARCLRRLSTAPHDFRAAGLGSGKSAPR